MENTVTLIKNGEKQQTTWKRAMAAYQWNILSTSEKIITVIALGTQIRGKYVNSFYQRKTRRG